MTREAKWNGTGGTVQFDARDAKNWILENIRNGLFLWNSSGSGVDEWYLTTAASGDPLFNAPDFVQELIAGVLTDMTLGVVSSLALNEHGFGNADTLGFNTIYGRFEGGLDPNDLAIGGVVFFAIPKTGDSVRLIKGSLQMTINADFSDTVLGAWVNESGHEQAFGLPGQPLILNVTSFDSASVGIGNVHLLDPGGAIPVIIRNTAPTGSVQNFGLRIRIDDGTLVDLRGGSIFVDPASIIVDVEVDTGARACLPAGITITGKCITRGTTLIEEDMELLIEGGTTTTDKAAAVDPMVGTGGTVISNATGAVLVISVDGSCIVSFLASSVARAFGGTSISRKGNGKIRWNPAIVTGPTLLAGTGICELGPASSAS